VTLPTPLATATAVAVGCGASAWWDGSILDKIVTWTLVILGWLVVSYGHNRREHRKEVRASLVECTRDIRDIETKAHDYRLNTSGASPERKPMEMVLRSRLKGLGAALELLRTHDGIDASDALIALRQAVTLNDFESSSREKCAPDSIILYEISDAAHGLVSALENAFRSCFR
jgi:hypothetical protein